MISIIVTTYNWPQALGAVLRALYTQTENRFEIIVADDGSKEETLQVIQEFQKNYKHSVIPLVHVWQPDQGFRVAAIRNKALQKAKGEYIIFLDGDCIPMPDFIARHRALAEKGYFVFGNRVLLSASFTEILLKQDIFLSKWNILNWVKAYIKGHSNRILPLIRFPLRMLDFWRYWRPKKWQGAKGCNLGVWKNDLLRINGWEETFSGWGFEDSDLVIRLIRAGIKRKDGRFATPVVHLWHPENDQSKRQTNWDLFLERNDKQCILALQGLNQN